MKRRLFIGLTTIITIIFICIYISLNLVNESKSINITTNKKLNIENEIDSINEANDTNDSIVNDTSIYEEIDDQIIKENNEFNSIKNIESNEIDTANIIQNNSSNYIQIQSTNYLKNEAFAVLALINEIRLENGLNELTWNYSLEESASTRTYEIVNTFEHTRPDGNDWYTAINTSFKAAGENIAAGQSTPTQVVNEWMASPGHRENILNPNFTKMGVALYYDSNDPYEYYWVQLFIGN